MSRYQHEVNLAPVRPFDCLRPLTRQFTGAAHIHRAYVLNKTTGQIVEACGHQHRTPVAASQCAEKMLAGRVAVIAEQRGKP